MIEKNIRLEPHHPRDLLVGRRSDNKRPKYQPPGGGATSLGSRRDVGGSGSTGGNDRDPNRGWQTYAIPEAPTAPVVTTAKAPPSILSRPDPVVTTAVAPPSILSRPDPVVTTAKAPPSILSKPDPVVTTAKAPPSILARDKVVPPSMLGGAEDALWTPPIKDIVDFGDDARAQHLQTIQEKAVINWNNKTEREKEEQQEKWDAAESKVKLQKEGSIWKTLGNLALAMIVPALLPAELARGYNLYKTASKASAFAKKIGLTEQDAVQYVKNNLLKGKDLTSLVAGDQNVIAKNMTKFSGKGDQADSNEEYTEKIVQAVDVKPTDQITNEQRQKITGQLNYVQKILQQGYFMDAQGRRQELTEDHRRQLSDFMNQADAYLNPYRDKKVAHGGRIDKALEGRNRYI